MGHLFVCSRSALAHGAHMHMCRHGSTAVSLGSLMQMTHSLPASSPVSMAPLSELVPSFAAHDWLSMP